MEAGFPGHTTPEQDAAQRQLEGRVASQLSTPGGANFVMAFGGKDVCLLRMLRSVSHGTRISLLAPCSVQWAGFPCVCGRVCDRRDPASELREMQCAKVRRRRGGRPRAGDHRLPRSACARRTRRAHSSGPTAAGRCKPELEARDQGSQHKPRASPPSVRAARLHPKWPADRNLADIHAAARRHTHGRQR